LIHTIQGSGAASPEDGNDHIIEGVVVGDFQDPDDQFGGFFVQEEDAEAELFQQYGTDPDKMISDLEREALIALKVTQYLQEMKAMQTQLAGAPQADPIVQLKEQELQQRAAKDQADAQIKQQQIANEQMRIQQNAQSDQARIQSQEKIADQRADVARERIYAPKG